MTSAQTTNHVAEVAVPGQSQITVRLADGEIEFGQEYDHEWHAIYVQPDNVLRLVRSLLVMVGLEDACLYERRGGLCHDVDWPEVSVQPAGANACSLGDGQSEVGRPKDRTAAERQRRHRAKLRDSRDADRDSNRGTVTEEPELRLVAAE